MSGPLKVTKLVFKTKPPNRLVQYWLSLPRLPLHEIKCELPVWARISEIWSANAADFQIGQPVDSQVRQPHIPRTPSSSANDTRNVEKWLTRLNSSCTKSCTKYKHKCMYMLLYLRCDVGTCRCAKSARENSDQQNVTTCVQSRPRTCDNCTEDFNPQPGRPKRKSCHWTRCFCILRNKYFELYVLTHCLWPGLPRHTRQMIERFSQTKRIH